MKPKYWPQVKGHEGSFSTNVEIPITVYYEFQPAERMTRDYPGCSVSICINSIEYRNIPLPAMLREALESELEGACWDDLDET